MLSATRALARTGQIGVALPRIEALGGLYDGYFKYRPRGGNVTMIAGIPGAQKSGLALYMASQWAAMGVEGLYISADLDQHTAMTRTAAALTGDMVDNVASAIETNGGLSHYSEILDIPLRFSFEPDPTLGDVRKEVDAWVETWDNYPKVIVVDNLLDVIPESGDSETTGYKSILLETKKLARKTAAHVFILHHMSESSQGGKHYDPYEPPPRTAVMGKVSQTPENVMSVAFDSPRSQIAMSMVKHRGGPSDPSGQIQERVQIDAARNTIYRRPTF